MKPQKVGSRRGPCPPDRLARIIGGSSKACFHRRSCIPPCQGRMRRQSSRTRQCAKVAAEAQPAYRLRCVMTDMMTDMRCTHGAVDAEWAGRAECAKLAYLIGGKRWTGLTTPLLRGVMVARSIPFATLKIISIRSPASGYLSCPPPKYKGRMKHGRYGRV